MRSVKASFIILGFYGVLVGAASLAVIGGIFHPVKMFVDLSHTDQRLFLEGPWDTRPDARFPGVMAARDRGQPVHIMMTLPAAETYQGRWKLKFDRMDQVVDLHVNETVVATVRPSRTGKAEKFAGVIPARAVVPGLNRITFVNRGTPGGTEYELIRLQNYQTVLAKDQAYLIPQVAGDVAPRLSSHRAALPRALAVAAVVVAIAAGTAWGAGRLTGQAWADALLGERMACAPLLALALLGVLPSIAPYRVTCTAPWFWQLAAMVLVVGHAPLILGWLLQMAVRKVASLDPASSAELLSDALGQGRRLSKTGAVLVTSGFKQGWWLSRTGVKWSVTGLWAGMRLAGFGVRECWRWFLRQQHPKGYARIFCYAAVVALLSHWVFLWEWFAGIVGYAAGVALVIAVVWESLVSLEEDD